MMSPENAAKHQTEQVAVGMEVEPVNSEMEEDRKRISRFNF